MKYLLSALLIFATFSVIAQSDSPVGFWKTVDDNTGETRSVIEIYKNANRIEGRIHKLLDADAPETCDACPGDKKDAKLIGMIMMWDLLADDDEWSGGKIMDPENGNVYKCFIKLESKDKLKVRGYMGFRLAGRTQYWYRDTSM